MSRSQVAATKGEYDEYGTRNKLKVSVTSIKKGDIVTLVKFKAAGPADMASVITTESVEEPDLKAAIENSEGQRYAYSSRRYISGLPLKIIDLMRRMVCYIGFNLGDQPTWRFYA